MAPHRSDTFVSPARQPLVDNPDAALREDLVRGSLPWCNPTRARFDLSADTDQTAPAAAVPSSSQDDEAAQPSSGNAAQVEWRSRDNRKGRHILIIPRHEKKADYPQPTNTLAGVRKGIWRMMTVYAWWDVSWWIAVLFSVGSAIFFVCGFFYWLPLADPSTTFPGESLIAGGVTSAVGATLFTIGGVLLIVEATNDNQTGCFGWAVEHAFSRSDDEIDDGSSSGARAANGVKSLGVRKAQCVHHHSHGLHVSSEPALQHPQAGRKWEWWPSWHELTTHYFHEIGFLASFILALGAVVFYISGLMALPGIINNISTGVLNGVYWLAYLVGGILFTVSSVLYVLETQPNWYTPAPKLIGWNIGVWNLIGSIGWTLSASFGYCTKSWCEYQSDLSLVWASLAFLIGSLLLWYESLDKYPVERA